MKAKQGCWTCKQRKIGCDRDLPVCHNCTRTGRHCLGYGLRLLWPDRHDGRRKDSGFVVYEPPENPLEASKNYGRHFLNVNHNDVASSLDPSSYNALIARTVSKPTRTLNLYPTMVGQDAIFMSYYERVIAPMISTTQVTNGFRTDLVQMVLSRGDSATKALWNSMMAVAAFHRSGTEAAFTYKTNAVRYLSASLTPGHETSSIDLNQTQFAASMMLCIYSVFDETDGHWTTHLDGAKYMLEGLYPEHRRHIKADFLFTWFLYHEVLACFSQPMRQAHNCIDVLFLLGASNCDATLILGALGCSLETIAIIHRVNKFRIAIIQKEIDPLSPKLIQQRFELEHTLHNLVQRLDPDEEAGEAPARRTRILATAELYRIGTILYLLHVIPLPGDDEQKATYLEEVFDILERLGVATSPWPIFMVACECQTDEQRIRILRILDLMNNVRNIGNIRVMRNLIETCWKHYDLQADSTYLHRTKWWEFVNYETAVPWFI
ncbi:fungal-specific transcription factor domain-containing protein [Trichoderma sp. SZMC 28013]